MKRVSVLLILVFMGISLIACNDAGASTKTVSDDHTTETVSEGDAFIGNWCGNHYYGTYMEVIPSDLPRHYNISISVQDGAWAWTTWQFDALYTNTQYGGSLVYEDGECSYFSGIEGQDEPEKTIIYSDGTGTFYFDEKGRLFWEDEKDGTFDDDYFVNAEVSNERIAEESATIYDAPASEKTLSDEVPGNVDTSKLNFMADCSLAVYTDITRYTDKYKGQKYA